MNVDLCFVPATHEVAAAVPAVSGSSGRLIVSQPKVAAAERTWPGRVFAREELSYREAMAGFVAAREAAAAKVVPTSPAAAPAQSELKAVKWALREEEQWLRVERGKERARRRLIEQAWQGRKEEQRQAMAALPVTAAGIEGEADPQRAGLQAQYRAEWAERHRELARRRQADARWREARGDLRRRQQEVGIGLVMAWIAILVIVDNCTRQGLGLPLFAMGAHVTAELVVEALATLLPKGLAYLIADGGTHFTADVLKELAKGRGLVRVPLARHRPQSNGIAERFVETLKGWLARSGRHQKS